MTTVGIATGAGRGMGSACSDRLGPVGARICAVSPGIIDTPQWRQEAETHAIMADMVKRTPLGRASRAEEVATVVAFLLSEEASFATGIDILVDGGVHAVLKGAAAVGTDAA